MKYIIDSHIACKGKTNGDNNNDRVDNHAWRWVGNARRCQMMKMNQKRDAAKIEENKIDDNNKHNNNEMCTICVYINYASDMNGFVHSFSMRYECTFGSCFVNEEPPVHQFHSCVFIILIM